MDKRPALGKGLSALIPDAPQPRLSPTEVDIDLLSPNEYQPRQRPDDARLDDLARSIKGNGIIQPIVVRKADGGYRIITGERRWRAAQRAGLTRVPIVVREIPPGQEAQLLELALIENIQREDLNPIEEAAAYDRLIDEFHLTQEAIAAAVGKDRSSIANCLRLLNLPEEVRAEVAGGRLSMGHARAVLALADEAAERRVAREVIARSLSVRETEALVKKLTSAATSPPAEGPAADVHARADRASRERRDDSDRLCVGGGTAAAVRAVDWNAVRRPGKTGPTRKDSPRRAAWPISRRRRVGPVVRQAHHALSPSKGAEERTSGVFSASRAALPTHSWAIETKNEDTATAPTLASGATFREAGNRVGHATRFGRFWTCGCSEWYKVLFWPATPVSSRDASHDSGPVGGLGGRCRPHPVGGPRPPAIPPAAAHHAGARAGDPVGA